MKKIVTVTMLLALALITCDNSNNESDPCACLTAYGTTAHLGIDEICPCGGKDCNCMEQFAYVDTDNTIKICKEKGISVADMNTAVTALKTSYTQAVTGMGGIGRLDEITAIHLTNSGAGLSYNANGILNIRIDQVAEVVEAEVLYAIGTGTVEQGWTVE